MNWLLLIADTNMTNITSNFFRWSLTPYINVLGSFAIPLIMLLPLLIINAKIGMHKVVALLGWLLFVGLVCNVLFDPALGYSLQIISAMLMTPFILYTFFKKGWNY